MKEDLNMSVITLQVGRTYRNTNNHILNIVSTKPHHFYGTLFLDPGGFTYLANGNYVSFGHMKQDDLIEDLGEFKKPTPSSLGVISSISDNVLYSAIQVAIQRRDLLSHRLEGIETIIRETCKTFRNCIKEIHLRSY